MGTADINAMLAEDLNEWETLCKVLEARPKGPVHGVGNKAWNSRDVYTHMARWMNHCSDYLETVRDGKKPLLTIQESQIEEVNTRWQKEDSQLSHANARHRAQAAFTRRAKLIQDMPPALWTEEMLRVVRSDGAAHYRDHRYYIIG